MAASSFANARPTLKRRYFLPLVQRLVLTFSGSLSLFAAFDSSRRDQHSVFSIVAVVAFAFLITVLWVLPQTMITTRGIRRLNSLYRTIPWADITEFSTRRWSPSRDVVYVRLHAGNRLHLGGVPSHAIAELQRSLTPECATSSG
jgi:hypothetical protein